MAEPRPTPDGLVAVTVPAAQCLVYPARGAMPDAVIAAWREVWAAFPAGSSGRAYTADVEVHDGDGADLYIAVDLAG